MEKWINLAILTGLLFLILALFWLVLMLYIPHLTLDLVAWLTVSGLVAMVVTIVLMMIDGK